LVTGTVSVLTANRALTNLTGSASSMTATSSTPQTPSLHDALPISLIATVKDAGNNPVAGVVVTFAAPGSGASGTFAGNANTATSKASGMAALAFFTANASLRAYDVSASVGALSANFALTSLTGSAS